jgi:hypothetical protein
VAIEVLGRLTANGRILAQVDHPYRGHNVHEEPDRLRVKDANLDGLWFRPRYLRGLAAAGDKRGQQGGLFED